MKKMFFTIVACLVLTSAFAQDAFVRGDKVVNATLGFINTLHTGNGWKTNVPPIAASFEYGIVDNLFDDKSSIGIGGYIGYASQKWELPALTSTINYSDFIVGARGSFHYQFVKNLDTYVGLMLGYDIVSGDGNNIASGVAFGYYIGARYYFNNKFAVVAEIGDNIGLISLGVAYKF